MFFFYIDYWISALIFVKKFLKIALIFFKNFALKKSPYFSQNLAWKPVKIEYTELKLSCGNDPGVKYSIYSNGDLDIMTPK
jgi:hypothetical protein